MTTQYAVVSCSRVNGTRLRGGFAVASRWRRGGLAVVVASSLARLGGEEVCNIVGDPYSVCHRQCGVRCSSRSWLFSACCLAVWPSGRLLVLSASCSLCFCVLWVFIMFVEFSTKRNKMSYFDSFAQDPFRILSASSSSSPPMGCVCA